MQNFHRLILILFIITVLLVLLANSVAGARDASKQDTLKERQVVVENYTAEFGTEALEALGHALDTYPQNNLFRVSWTLMPGIVQGRGSAVYNREKQTVKYWYDVQTVEYRTAEHCLVLVLIRHC